MSQCARQLEIVNMRCAKQAKPNSLYCWQHDSMPLPSYPANRTIKVGSFILPFAFGLILGASSIAIAFGVFLP